MREWLYGRNAVYEALLTRRRSIYRLFVAQGIDEKGRIAAIIELAGEQGIKVERPPKRQVEAISSGAQGVALETGAYPFVDLEDILGLARQRQQAPFLLILDVIQDPQNLATLIRSAEGVGVHGILLPLRQAAGVTPAVVNASAGASEHLLICQLNLAQAIERLKKGGLWVIGLEDLPEAKTPAEVRLDGPLALVVGSEGSGMRPLVRQSCDLLVRLPMVGQIHSYNAAVAGSIVLFLAYQARGNT